MMPILQAAIELFAQLNPQYALPKEASGNCGLAVDQFAEFIEALGLPFEIDEVHFVSDGEALGYTPRCYYYSDPDHNWYVGGCDWWGHIVALVEGLCVDFTARQFNENCPFPLTFSLSTLETKHQRRLKEKRC